MNVDIIRNNSSLRNVYIVDNNLLWALLKVHMEIGNGVEWNGFYYSV